VSGPNPVREAIKRKGLAMAGLHFLCPISLIRSIRPTLSNCVWPSSNRMYCAVPAFCCNALTALENWTDAGTAPDAIVAAHYVNNTPALGIDRTMPLCKFREQAENRGSGSYNDDESWTCSANHKLLEVGPDGAAAGL